MKRVEEEKSFATEGTQKKRRTKKYPFSADYVPYCAQGRRGDNFVVGAWEGLNLKLRAR